MKVDQISDFVQKYNNTGIYLTAYRYKSEDQKGELYADYLYHDFDDKRLLDAGISEEIWTGLVLDIKHAVTVYEVFYGIPSRYIHFYFSGKKGISMLIPAEVLGYGPHEHLNMIFREIIAEIGHFLPNKTLDYRIYDRIRLWRVDNSIHEKSGLYKIPLSYQELTTLSIGEIIKLAKTQRCMCWEIPAYPIPKALKKIKDRIKNFKVRLSGDKPNKVIDFVPPCIEHLLTNETIAGSRNNTAAALANFFCQHGISEDEALSKMGEWNSMYCVPHLGTHELHNTTRSAYRSGKTWGCASLRELSQCDQAKCRFGKKEDKHGS